MFPHRTTRAGAVALAIAAAAAPAAIAKPMDAPADYKLPQGFQTADPSDASPSQDFRHPDTVDYADGRGTYNAPDVVVVKQPAPVVQPAADGMDWADIGLGAGSVMGLSLIALGGGLLIVRRRGAHPVAG
jgi:hypothetical protein